MNKLSAAFCAMALMLGGTLTTQAQETKTYPHMFIGLQGGVQTTLPQTGSFGDAVKVMTPTGAVSFGAYFNRVVGTRLHLNGIWNKGLLEDSKFKYEYSYLTTDVDLLLNITNLFRQGDDHVFNFILLGGVGLNTAWGNDQLNNRTSLNRGLPYMWDGTHLTHNARVGVQFNFNCTKNLDVNIEASANSLGDRYNSKMKNNDDWALNLMAGLAFKFGHRKAKSAPEPVVEVKKEEPAEVWETRIDTIWYDDVKTVEEIKDMSETYYVPYSLAKADGAHNTAEVKKAADFIRTYIDCKVSVTGYADKGTGNPKINLRYSKQRAENTVKSLIDAGIDKNIITSDYKGDTVQPFPNDNDRNRCAEVKVTGKKKVTHEVKERKFRTEEKRVRVQ